MSRQSYPGEFKIEAVKPVTFVVIQLHTWQSGLPWEAIATLTGLKSTALGRLRISYY